MTRPRKPTSKERVLKVHPKACALVFPNCATIREDHYDWNVIGQGKTEAGAWRNAAANLPKGKR